MKIVRINDKYYQLNFGLKGIKLLKEKSYTNVEENPPFFFYCALLHDNNCDFGCFASAFQKLSYDDQEELIQTLKEILPNLLNYSKEHLKDLYAKGIGEIGLSVEDFNNMTEEELEIAYEGYLHKKELEANLNQLALQQNKINKNKIIKLTEEPTHIAGSIEEREETFSTLGLKEI